MPAPGSATGEMGVIQAAQVLNNPLLAKDYVHQATQEFLQEKIQSRKSLPLENQERNLENIYQENKFSINSQHEKNRQDFREKYKEKADAID
jgi:CMP-N-acetylneuraminic acid synthetase